MIRIGKLDVVFGIPEQMKPLRNPPPGKIRLRFRNEDFATAYVRTNTGIASYLLSDDGDAWVIRDEYRQGVNLRPQ